MTHHRFGSMVGEPSIGGIVDIPGSVLFREYRTLGVETVSASAQVPAIAVELTGEVVGSPDDTVTVVFLMSAMDAGVISAALCEAAEGLGPQVGRDFMIGVATRARQ